MDYKKIKLVLLPVLLGASIIYSVYIVASRYIRIKEKGGFNIESISLLSALSIILGIMNLGMYKLYIFVLQSV